MMACCAPQIVKLPTDDRKLRALPSQHDWDSFWWMGEYQKKDKNYHPANRFSVRNDCGVMCEEWEANRCNLVQGNKWHPAAAISEFLRLERFSHISSEDAGKALAKKGFLLRHHVLGQWNLFHGLYCKGCRTIHRGCYEAIWWRDHEICEACFIKSKKRGYELVRERRIERQFQDKINAWAKEKHDERVKKLEDRKRRRLLEKAAYEFLNELGILPSPEGVNEGTGKLRREAAVLARVKSARSAPQDHA